jgi:hypothetical protein
MGVYLPVEISSGRNRGRDRRAGLQDQYRMPGRAGVAMNERLCTRHCASSRSSWPCPALIHRSGLTWVRLGVLTGFGAALVAIVAATAAVSSPDWALWLARDMAWDGSNIWDYQKYLQQPIASPPVAYQFPQNLPPPALQTIDYTVNGCRNTSRVKTAAGSGVAAWQLFTKRSTRSSTCPW